MQLPFTINLLPDGSVVHQDGEYLGTWDTDESDAHFQFTPDGAEAVLFYHPYRWRLCEMIAEWLEQRQSASLGQKKKPAS